MNDLISRLKSLHANLSHDQQSELQTIIDELRRQHITMSAGINQRRHDWEMPFPDDAQPSLEHDLDNLLLAVDYRLQSITEDAAILRTVLEKIVTSGTAPERSTDPAHTVTHLIYLAQSGLETDTGAARRADLRHIEQMLDEWESNAREFGSGFYRSGDSLAERARRLVAYYQRQAATAVSGAQAFRDYILIWMRGMAINAESVSWAGTHAEKNARLRGLIEVIEAACNRINDLRLDNIRTTAEFSAWLRNDYPVRDLVRALQQKDQELESLKSRLSQHEPGAVTGAVPPEISELF